MSKKKKAPKRFSFRELYKGMKQDISEQTNPNKPIGKGKAKLFIDVNK